MQSLLEKQLVVQEQWIYKTERFLPGALQRVANRQSSGQQSLTEFFVRKNLLETVEQVVLGEEPPGST